jgi:hypothetical protein
MVPVENDADVARVQRRLRALKIETGPVDGDFGVLTEYAVRLFQSRSAAPSGDPLEIDGIVGPQTWGALFGVRAGLDAPPRPLHQPAPDTARAILDVAAAEVGVREVPLNSNRGPRVDQYIRATGLDPAAGSYPWCMCFVYWCHLRVAERLGAANLCPRLAGVHATWAAANKMGGRIVVVSAAQARRNPGLVVPGMVFFIDTGGGAGHVGIVAENTNASLSTIEGNTNDNGSREGIGVFRRSRRRISDISLGFAGFWMPAEQRSSLPPQQQTVPAPSPDLSPTHWP